MKISLFFSGPLIPTFSRREKELKTFRDALSRERASLNEAVRGLAKPLSPFTPTRLLPLLWSHGCEVSNAGCVVEVQLVDGESRLSVPSPSGGGLG